MATMSESTNNIRKRKRNNEIEGKSLSLNLRRRKETLLKKSKELAIKSDVVVCLVCIGPKGEIDVWPEHEKAKEILEKHKEQSTTGTFGTQENRKIEDGDQSSLTLWTTLLSEMNSKLETLNAKIQKLSKKSTDFSESSTDREFSRLNDILPLQSMIPTHLDICTEELQGIVAAEKNNCIGDFGMQVEPTSEYLDDNDDLLIDNPYGFLFSHYQAWV